MFLNLVDVQKGHISLVKKKDIFQCCCCVDIVVVFIVNDIESINLGWTLGRLCIEECSFCSTAINKLQSRKHELSQYNCQSFAAGGNEIGVPVQL
jgi:hypothetical protein